MATIDIISKKTPVYAATVVDFWLNRPFLAYWRGRGSVGCFDSMFEVDVELTTGFDSRIIVLLPSALLQRRLPYFVFLLANRTGYVRRPFH